jgi:hypothetical protein
MGVGVNWTVELVRFGLPPPTGQNCGSLQHGFSFFIHNEDGTARADVTVKPLNCFWRAYQTCKAATIAQTLAGTDAGHTDTLTIEQRNNRCAIYGHEEWSVNTDRGSGTYLCTQLSKEGDDLQVSACDGAESFTLFARDPAYESYQCGVVGAAGSENRTPLIEECFGIAYHQCLARTMGYGTTIDRVPTQRNFYIDNHCGIAYQRGFAPRQSGVNLAACASLLESTDGLHFSQCGTDGDIFVPSDVPLCLDCNVPL